MVDTPGIPLSASELIDDVFQFDDVTLGGNERASRSSIFGTHFDDGVSGYKLVAILLFRVYYLLKENFRM
jgi:hypothetical protein